MKNTKNLPFVALAVTFFLLLFAEFHAERPFLRQEFWNRIHFSQEARRMADAIQDHLENPQVCRQSLRATNGPLHYNGENQQYSESPRFLPITENLEVRSQDLRVSKAWLTRELTKMDVKKNDGVYIVRRAYLVIELVSNNKEKSFYERVLIPLRITTGPDASEEVLDCVAIKIFR